MQYFVLTKQMSVDIELDQNIPMSSEKQRIPSNNVCHDDDRKRKVLVAFRKGFKIFRSLLTLMTSQEVDRSSMSAYPAK